MSQKLGFEQVSKSFNGQEVLKELTLWLPQGRASSIMGPTGCGKTTLLRLLMGQIKPDSGKVHTLRPVSAVFQEDRLLERLSASGNLRLVTGNGHHKDISELLEELGLNPQDQKPVRDFSGGMKRRVAIARALIHPHALLLLDEPFKGLDEATRALVASVILRRTQGKTLVLVTHDKAEATLLEAAVYLLS